MISDQRYVTLSLELHLFFARIMKEHALFLEAGFMPKDSKFASEADYYKKEFERLLSSVVSMSNGMIRPNVLQSGEIITDFTLGTEQKTQNLTGININQNITVQESKLQSESNPQVSPNLVRNVSQLNANAKKLLNGLISFKQRILEGVLSCKLFTANYPLLIEHILREAKLYLSLVNDLENRVDIDAKDVRETELFWDQIMMEHALFIRGLLDPSEEALIDTADEFADEFKDLIEMAQTMTTATINNVTDETLNQTIELKNFKQAGTDGIARCKIRSIILPLLADHVLREANHYIRLLETYTQG
ncbi:MAG: DUF2935 domain-containing protein [Candidatus Niameybacter stercoravium]|nr:DUF2935 domain-containing protein [Candidatus Niameybacter stercoravium]